MPQLILDTDNVKASAGISSDTTDTISDVFINGYGDNNLKRALLCIIVTEDWSTNEGATSVKLGDFEFTSKSGFGTSNGGVEHWYLLNPPMGYNDVTVTYDSAIDFAFVVYPISWAKQSSSIFGAVSLQGTTSGDPELVITTGLDHSYIIDGCVCNGADITADAGQTTYLSVTVGARRMRSSVRDIYGESSVTIGYDQAAPETSGFYFQAMPVKEATTALPSIVTA